MANEATPINSANSRFANTFTPEEIKKARKRKQLPDGTWVAVGIANGRMTMKDANSGKYGINAMFIPLPSLTADMKEGKRAYSLFNTFWAWFRDPANKARKPGNTYGLFEGWVRAAEPTMPSDGSSAPALAKRDPDSDQLVGPDGKPLASNAKDSKRIADEMQLAYDTWVKRLYVEAMMHAEAKTNPHPLAGFTCYGKVTHSKGTGDTVFANIGNFRKELPEDAELFDLEKLKGLSDDEDEADEDGESDSDE